MYFSDDFHLRRCCFTIFDFSYNIRLTGQRGGFRVLDALLIFVARFRIGLRQ